jgi:ABC-2 type transport system ATP-binding protein
VPSTPQHSNENTAPRPMISVRGLTKRYGAVSAIDGVEFSVQRGEVVGLLGPNGAGKTTTMRILCGSLGASAGTAEVEGLDVSEHPAQVKSRIGYLPESPPLYPSMIVSDYLRFAGVLRGVASPAEAAARVAEQVGLHKTVGGRPASERIIGHLSKGYQQRVGLAQALIHSPDVLVLDEPTSGLDPGQRKEIRQLLLELAREADRTVILSTHVLADVEAICSRVVIIDQGVVIAQDTIEALQHQGGSVQLELARPGPEAQAALSSVPGVLGVEIGSNGILSLQVQGECRAEIAAAAIEFGLLSLQRAQSLEDVFLRLTGAQS